jgi:hypothetical protein
LCRQQINNDGIVAESIAMPDQRDNTRIVKSTNSVRQGVTGHNVRWVLAISILSAIVCLGVVWMTLDYFPG